MPVDQEFDNVLAWAKEHDQAFAERIEADPVYFKKILNIEKDRPNPRKDYAKYSDIYPLIRFFFAFAIPGKVHERTPCRTFGKSSERNAVWRG